MMDTHPNAEGDALSGKTVIDTFAFARHGKRLAGRVPISRLHRVMDDLPGQLDEAAVSVDWSVQGETDVHGRAFLRLRVQAQPVLACQRCLGFFTYTVDSDVVMELVRSVDDLDADAAFEEPTDENSTVEIPEKVVGSHRFDLLEQIEDELLLCIPYVPKHEVCPSGQLASVSDPSAAADADDAAESERGSPFAVLEQLKRKI